MDARLKDSLATHFHPNSPAHKAVTELNELVGYPYPLKIHWSTIRDDIPLAVLDSEALVLRVDDILAQFIRRIIATLLSFDVDEKLTDKFLERTQISTRAIVLKPHPYEESGLPFTRFTDRGEVELYLPRYREGFASDGLFGNDLVEALDGYSFSDPRAQLSTENEDIESISTSQPQQLHPVKRSFPKILPHLGQLPRPEALSKKPPLYLRLTEQSDPESFSIDGYQPAVDLIYEYLSKHAQEPDIAFSLYRKPIRWGENLSQINVESGRADYFASSLTVVSLIEGQLGFERIGSPFASGGGNVVWLFQRNEEFIVL